MLDHISHQFLSQAKELSGTSDQSLPDLETRVSVFRDLKWLAFTEETVTIRVYIFCSVTQTMDRNMERT